MRYFQSLGRNIHTLIIKPHTVDDGLVRLQAEEPLFRIPFLGFRGECSDFC